MARMKSLKSYNVLTKHKKQEVIYIYSSWQAKSIYW